MCVTKKIGCCILPTHVALSLWLFWLQAFCPPYQWLTMQAGALAIDWCSMDTGQTTIKEKHLEHTVYVSVTRDGSVWIRAGQDHKSQDWIYNNEHIHSFVVRILDSDTLSLLESINYSDSCVLTDVNLVVRAEGGWHPSYISVFDPDPKEKSTRILQFFHDHRHTGRDCNMRTNFTLNRTKQGIICNGGKTSACGIRRTPPKDRDSRTLFIKMAAFDPRGEDYYECDVFAPLNMYTFTGSFYHVYVKVASCEEPTESRVLGHEAKLRAFPRGEEVANTIMIPDPTQTAINDGVITGWWVFIKVLSIQHEIYLQVWRPDANNPNIYSLVGQTFYRPRDLRLQKINLDRDEYIHVRKGDVLGFYFPKQNPIAWSPVPCAFDMQSYKFIENPTNVLVGRTKVFSMPHSGIEDACRHYSVTAIFSNKTHAKRIEDWICPTADPPAGMRRRSGAHRTQGLGINKITGTNTKTNTLKPSYGVSNNKEIAPLNGAIPLHLILIIVGCLILLLIIVGFISYYRAIRS